MALSNAERQKRHREKLKAKAAMAGGAADPLEALRMAWASATPEQRSAFAREANLTTGSSSGTTSLPAALVAAITPTWDDDSMDGITVDEYVYTQVSRAFGAIQNSLDECDHPAVRTVFGGAYIDDCAAWETEYAAWRRKRKDQGEAPSYPKAPTVT